MDDEIGALHGAVHGLRVADVLFDGRDLQALQVRGVAGVGLLVEVDDLPSGTSLQKMTDKIRPDEAQAAGD